jgi:phosphohistidine phosphatase
MDLSPQTEVFLIRHGIAAERGTYADDDQRPLLEKGRSRTQAVAERFLAIQGPIDLLLTSPLVRAQQTAEILLTAGLSSVLEISPELAPEGQLIVWLEWLKAWQNKQPISRIALIGHEPDLSAWAQCLVHDELSDRWVLKKAGIIGLQVPSAEAAIGQSLLFWLTPPRYFL